MPQLTITPRREDLKLIGYFARNTQVPDNWRTSAATGHVTEICSAGHIHPETGWIEPWLHNEWGFLNSPTDAELVVPLEGKGFAVFAYRVLPIQFIDGRMHRLKIGQLEVEPLPESFAFFGFDTVNRTCTEFFECSPLSCNLLANEVPVNQYCLVETFEEAVELAQRCSIEKPEPGTYFVLEVLREAGPARAKVSGLL